MLTIKYKIALTLFVLFILFSCSSGKVVDGSKSSSRTSMNNHLRKGTLAMGNVLQPYLFNDYQIAGMDISKTNKARSEEFDALLLELGLIRIEDMVQNGSPPTFISFKRKDNQPFHPDNDIALEQLRVHFGDSFGPVVIHESHVLQGALQPQIIVKFKQDVSDKDALSILREYKAIDHVFLVDQGAYLVHFPKGWGYKMMDVGKQLLSDERIVYVENRYFAIRKR